MRMLNLFLCACMCFFAQSCQRTKPFDLKSPCVSSTGDNSPCIRRPINTWIVAS